MNILHLKYAVEVAAVHSINKAAENLFMGQPNLSRAIKELELSLGITIFERTNKGMIVTHDGEIFLQYAKKILNQIDEVEKMYTSQKEEKQYFAVSVPRATYISHAFANFSKKINPKKQAEIFYKESNSIDTINNILKDSYKLGIIRYAAKFDKDFKVMLDEKGFSYELISEFCYVLVMSKKHPLAQVEDVTFDDLTNYIEIAHADAFIPSLTLSAIRKEELPENVNKRIYVFERASQFDLLSISEDTFMWVSPLPNNILEKYDLVQKKCKCNNKIYKDVLIYSNGYRFTELDNIFISEVCKSKRQILTYN